MVEVHAKGPWSVLPASFDSIPTLQNTVPVLVFLVFHHERLKGLGFKSYSAAD
jgi:hypothetical protein